MPGRRKAKFTDASAMLPRKACSAELRKFVVRLCTIRRASRVSRTYKIRAFCSKIGNRLQLGGRLYTRFPGPKLPSLIIRHANVQSRVPAQPVDATQALNLSAGVSNCKVS